jgi:hypothetical protein
MAVQEVTGMRGRVGNVIHYKMGDKYYSRAAPKKFRQTKATKRRANEFGTASTLAASIRRTLAPVITNPRDRKMQSRLVAAIFQWLSGTVVAADGSVPEKLSLFQFNGTDAIVHGLWRIDLQLKRISSGALQIEIPAFFPKEAISASLSTVSVKCTLAVAIIDLKTTIESGKFSTILEYNYNNVQVNRQTIPLPVIAPKSSLVVLGASIEYKLEESKTKRNQNKIIAPSGILRVMIT